MSPLRRVVPAMFLLALAICSCVPPQPLVSFEPGAGSSLRVLAFTRTLGYRHDSIPAARAALLTLASRNGWRLTATEDAQDISPATLAETDVVVFLLTSGDVLDSEQEAALEAFIRSGGGFVGVHSASDTEYGWPFYGELIGAWFQSHPTIQAATVRVEDPAFAPLPDPWGRTDEWYNFASNPRPRVQVLLTVDESSYQGGTLGADHPIAWRRPVDAGRAFYTAMGHTQESYAEQAFLLHLEAAIRWAGQQR